MSKLLTFIVPAYNAEAYITKCLDSFVRSNELDRTEIIVINDGSIDKTAQIAQQYIDQYPNSFRLITKINGGHGSAINEGFALSSGKYTKIIDSDDWILSVNLHDLLNVLSRTTAQVILLPYHTFDINTKKTELFGFGAIQFSNTYTLSEIVRKWRDFEHCISFHGLIYKSEFYRKQGIQLIEHVYYEDHEYATIPFCRANSIFPVDIPLYLYRIGDMSQSSAKKNQVKNLGHLEAVINHMVEFYKTQTGLTDEGKEFFYKKTEALILTYYKTACLIADSRKSRKSNRKRCSNVNKILFGVSLRWKHKLKNKYRIFYLLSISGVSADLYHAIVKSKMYTFFRKKTYKTKGEHL